ncbi:MAG TPA: S-adenosylmethionine:tRNA ribosyltransferase-isomerase [Puia sp.]
MSDLFPENLSISEFQYDLPEDKIARYPLPQRDASKLLIWQGGTISETRYARIADWLPAASLLVFNNSKVIAARLLFSKPSGGVIEIFCLEPADSGTGIHEAMVRKENGKWNCLIGGASKWKRGMVLEKKAGQTILRACFLEKKPDSFVVEFSWSPAPLSFAEVLHLLGSVPLPPYLKRHAEAADAERYQTIYAAEEGSVAAPTAGLHFTPQIFDSLGQKKIETLFVTLHVGAGTFMPVKTDALADHLMHEEYIEVRAETVRRLLDRLSGPVIAVGTTSLRTVESLYWLGLKVAENKRIPADALRISQWDPYRMDSALEAKKALHLLLEWIERQPDQKLITKTQLFIAPGYSFRIIRGLITNFHQPQSTLLLLVAALAGNDWKRIYQFALENDYRFLSYGDGCLFLP